MTEEFKKFDNGKPDLGLIPPILLEAYATIGTFGAKKYGKFNYRKAKLEDVPRYHSAFLRHYFSYMNNKGQTVGFLRKDGSDPFDVESGFPELWHALWNLVAIIEACEKFGSVKVSKMIQGME